MNKIIMTELNDLATTCPSQWEGKTINNRSLYFRYRFGSLTIEDITDGWNDNYVVQLEYGNEYAGAMTTEELIYILGIAFDFSHCNFSYGEGHILEELKDD